MDERYKSFYEDNKKLFPKSVYTNVKNHNDVWKNMNKIYQPIRQKSINASLPNHEALLNKRAAMEFVMDRFAAGFLREKKKPEKERRKTLLRLRKQSDERKERVKPDKREVKKLKLRVLSQRGRGGGGDMNPSRVKPELVTPPKSLLQR
tara:strand:+ start:88 stop:534 length:447 start_codon:yes stop_codon:yes gene_type:complete